MKSQAKSMTGQKYRPANGDECYAFYNHWCDHCEIEVAFRNEIPESEDCSIMEAAHILDVNDPGYPAEWCYDINGLPCCTAFIPEGTPIHYKDDVTADMFGDAHE